MSRQHENKSHFPSIQERKNAIEVARGLKPADLVLRNAHFLDVFSGEFRSGDIAVYNEKIIGIIDHYEGKDIIDASGYWIVPGFIDAHVHIESSLMTPHRFSDTVIPQGTTTVIWDPHEIANVWGEKGISWALEESEGLDLDVFVMVPSCVPATPPQLALETSGAELTPKETLKFKDHPRVLGLAEMMNFPGVLYGDQDVLTKLDHFQDRPLDGHAPGLSGKDLNAYITAGIHSCHESTTLKEGQEKLTKGIHVLIREGSCAKDADTLLPLLTPHSSHHLAYCSDDRNPLDIAEEGHINAILSKALKLKKDPGSVFSAASYAPAQFFGLKDRGAIAPGYLADFVLLKQKAQGDWSSGFEVVKVFKKGKLIQPSPKDRSSKIPVKKNLNLASVTKETFRIPAGPDNKKIRVIEVIPHQILTKEFVTTLKGSDGELKADITQDILKISVLERHHGTGRKTTAFVKGFGIKSGAIATSINHDSHNIIAVGSSDELLAKAVNELIKIDGGIVVITADGAKETLHLPIAGLMTDAPAENVTIALKNLKKAAQKIGCVLSEPFLQLSFLALPVIPSLKITDRGLVDVHQFKVVSLFKD